MKYNCKWCKCDVEISQSDKAKTGMRRLHDHEADCFKKHFPKFESLVERVVADKTTRSAPDKFDMQGIIKYLHESLGYVPSETQVLRFHMYLQTNPSAKECEDFGIMLRRRLE